MLCVLIFIGGVIWSILIQVSLFYSWNEHLYYIFVWESYVSPDYITLTKIDRNSHSVQRAQIELSGSVLHAIYLYYLHSISLINVQSRHWSLLDLLTLIRASTYSISSSIRCPRSPALDAFLSRFILPYCFSYSRGSFRIGSDNAVYTSGRVSRTLRSLLSVDLMLSSLGLSYCGQVIILNVPQSVQIGTSINCLTTF